MQDVWTLCMALVWLVLMSGVPALLLWIWIGGKGGLTAFALSLALAHCSGFVVWFVTADADAGYVDSMRVHEECVAGRFYAQYGRIDRLGDKDLLNRYVDDYLDKCVSIMYLRRERQAETDAARFFSEWNDRIAESKRTHEGRAGHE